MSFKSIAEKSYTNISMDVYESIPANEKLMMDVIYRNLKMKSGQHEYLIDIGINFEEINIDHSKNFYLEGNIADIGDLSVFTGYEDYDFSGYEIEPGKIYPTTFNNISEIEKIDYTDLIKRGFVNIRLNSVEINYDFPKIPLNIILNSSRNFKSSIRVEGNPDFLIKKNGVVKFAVINGFLFDPEHPDNFKGNSLFLK